MGGQRGVDSYQLSRLSVLVGWEGTGVFEEFHQAGPPLGPRGRATALTLDSTAAEARPLLAWTCVRGVCVLGRLALLCGKDRKANMRD